MKRKIFAAGVVAYGLVPEPAVFVYSIKLLPNVVLGVVGFPSKAPKSPLMTPCCEVNVPISVLIGVFHNPAG
ncbi:hypothetical protein D3C86_1937020 [compost metagenome]